MSHPADKAVAPRSATVAICGNPNCGKTTIFNAMTGLRQRVGNYPGVTVEKVSGRFEIQSLPDRRFTLVDVPGSYSLAAYSPDEYIAARALFGNINGEPSPDLIICVVDATNLERGLYLLFQVLQIGRPVVVALNMIDLSERRGIKIDHEKLSKRLGGLPVIPVIGSRGIGIAPLKQAVGGLIDSETAPGQEWYDPTVEKIVSGFAEATDNSYRSRAEYIRILFDAGGPAEQTYLGDRADERRALLDTGRKAIVEKFGSLSGGETAPLTGRAAELFQDVVAARPARKGSRTEMIDRVLLHPLLGPVLLVTLMTMIFQAIFSWAAPVMDLIDTMFGALAGQVEAVTSVGPLQSLLIDGVIGGVGSVLVFLPQIVILFLFIAVLEDSGYMPRAAFLVDRIFGWCGLSGKSFIPMLSSFACAIPGILATRTIENRKLRLITILVSPLMSCSARLPVYTIMIAAFIPHAALYGPFNSQGLVLTTLYLLGIAVAVIVSFILNKTILKTETGSFLMEMPTYKVPTARSILTRVYNRARSFLMRAGTVILAITIIIWALSYYPRSDEIAREFNDRQAVIERQFDAEVISDREHSALLVELAHARAGANLRNSYFSRFGRLVEPVFEPLGWDWKITMATLASFPAREVVIATLGTIFNLGTDSGEASSSLVDKMRGVKWEDGPRVGKPLFTPAVALSIMVFFALSCQCGATLVTIRQETNSWLLPAATFVYMTVLAYVAALVVYQVFSGWVG